MENDRPIAKRLCSWITSSSLLCLSGWLSGCWMDRLTDCLRSCRASVLSPLCCFPPPLLRSCSRTEAAAVLWGVTRQGGVDGCRAGGGRVRGEEHEVLCGGWMLGGGRAEGSFGGQEGKAGGRCKPPPQALTATQEGDHRRSAHRCFNITPPPPHHHPHQSHRPQRPLLPVRPVCFLWKERGAVEKETHTVLSDQNCMFLLVIKNSHTRTAQVWFSGRFTQLCSVSERRLSHLHFIKSEAFLDLSAGNKQKPQVPEKEQVWTDAHTQMGPQTLKTLCFHISTQSNL